MPDATVLLPVLALLVVFVAFAGLILLRKRGTGFTPLVLIALVVGTAIGLLFRDNLTYIAFLGDLYVQVILAIVAPLIFISVLSSVTSLGSTVKLRTIGLSSAFWLLLTNAVAIIITLAIAVSVGLGQGIQTELTEGSGDSLTGLIKPLDEVLLGLLPSNIAGDFVNNNIVGIILFALLFATAFIVANRNDDPQLRTFKNVIDGAKKVMMTAVGFVIELTPYAVLALVATTVSTAVTRLEDVLALVLVLVLAVGISFVVAYGVNGVLLRVFADVNPIHWFRYLTPAQYTAFTTQSSVGTLPLTIRALVRKVGVPEEVATFTAPVGTTIGMPGCAGVWPIIVAVFTINVLGIEYSAWDYIALAGLCLLVSLGTAGVPGTAIITATAVLSAAGLPVEVLVVLIPISAVAGTASTMANVSAAATAATIVARRLGALDDGVFRGRRSTASAPASPTPGTERAQQPVSRRELRRSTTAPTRVLSIDDEFTIPDGMLVGQCEIPPLRTDTRTAVTARIDTEERVSR